MTTMTSPAFDYRDRIEDHVREDMLVAYRRAWDRIAQPGTWWTGAERVAIAAESRAAESCALCERRAEALSPHSEIGEHDSPSGEILPSAAIDAVHRLVTDATRLTKN
ncbi:MAG: alkylhydroperoxidase-related (seleno)protein, partial [Myxococcota bacterium]